MELYRNQKLIRVIRAVGNKDNPYNIVNKAAEQKALKELKGNAFKLWCYLRDNKDEYEFGLSNKDACDKCGFSRPTYSAAVQEPIDKEYLVEVQLYENRGGYLFIETGYGGETE